MDKDSTEVEEIRRDRTKLRIRVHDTLVTLANYTRRPGSSFVAGRPIDNWLGTKANWNRRVYPRGGVIHCCVIAFEFFISFAIDSLRFSSGSSFVGIPRHVVSFSRAMKSPISRTTRTLLSTPVRARARVACSSSRATRSRRGIIWFQISRDITVPAFIYSPYWNFQLRNPFSIFHPSLLLSSSRRRRCCCFRFGRRSTIFTLFPRN